jgi:exonuclease VII small subunit
MSLNTLETGYSVLTLEEALQTFEDGEESKLFCLKLK